MLAKDINFHPGSISRIYGYASIQTEQLLLISTALQYDFFAIYSAQLNLKKPEPIPPPANQKSECEIQLEQKIHEIEALKKEIETLKMEDIKKENAYLKQINDLLKKKQ